MAQVLRAAPGAEPQCMAYITDVVQPTSDVAGYCLTLCTVCDCASNTHHGRAVLCWHQVAHLAGHICSHAAPHWRPVFTDWQAAGATGLSKGARQPASCCLTGITLGCACRVHTARGPQQGLLVPGHAVQPSGRLQHAQQACRMLTVSPSGVIFETGPACLPSSGTVLHAAACCTALCPAGGS